MKILFYLGHPAQFHFLKFILKTLQDQGNEVVIYIKAKDILEDLLKYSSINYTNILSEGRKNNLFSIAWGLIKREYRLFKEVKNEGFDIMVGSDPSIAHIGKLLNITSLITVEDDVHVIPILAKITFPFASHIITPEGCDTDRWKGKTIHYKGYQKLAYLHPNYFKPDKSKIKSLENERYFLIRLSSLSAYHDNGIKGIYKELLKKIIRILEKYGKILLSSEEKLSPEFEKYQLHININDIHHYLYYADILISDSQSMSVEAALLGTPSIRFSDFTGKISVLEELETKYGLTYGIRPSDPQKLINLLTDLLKQDNLKKNFFVLRKKMLVEKIDVTSFFVWFIRNYPKSAEIMKVNPDYQNNFK